MSGLSESGIQIAFSGNNQDSGKVNPDPDTGAQNVNQSSESNENRIDIPILCQTAAYAGDHGIRTFCPVESFFQLHGHDSETIVSGFDDYASATRLPTAK